MEIIRVLDVVKKFFGLYIRPVYRITNVHTHEKSWKITVEVIEEKEYMKAHAKDELIGVYTVQLNPELEVVAFQRISLRSRGATINHV